MQVATFAEPEKEIALPAVHSCIWWPEANSFAANYENLCTGQVNDTVLKTIFMEKMPGNVKAILISSGGTMDEIAEQADRELMQLSASIAPLLTIRGSLRYFRRELRGRNVFKLNI